MANELDPRLTPAQRFGRELARMRKSAGLSQVALSKHLGCSASLIAHIEIAARNPTADFAKRCDAFFGTEDRFARLQRDIASPATGPGWYLRWSTEIEPRARVLRSWDPLLVPGLLQTEDYARALFAGALAKNADEVEAKVSARLRRQLILDRADSPLLWVLLDEGVLYRRIGTPMVMVEQLVHLVTVAASPRITIQLVPQDTGCTAGYLSSFLIAELSDAPMTVSIESAGRGEVTAEHGIVTEIWDRYDKLRAEAYRVPESLQKIKEVQDQWKRKT